jgi:hypothetical protein
MTMHVLKWDVFFFHRQGRANAFPRAARCGARQSLAVWLTLSLVGWSIATMLVYFAA